MSTQALTSLHDYLCSTLSVADMNWLAKELNEFAKKEEEFPLKCYTMEEINAMLDAAEVEIAAGKGTPHEEVMRKWDEKIARMKRE